LEQKSSATNGIGDQAKKYTIYGTGQLQFLWKMEDVPARTLPENPSITMIAHAALEGKVEWQVSARKIVVQVNVAICGD
jgi:hypothetical protein